jgi:hypothetical protein
MNFSTIFENSLTSMPLIAEMTPRIWYAIPLIVVVSLVYGATRHENLREIFVHSTRSAVWVVGFMAFIFFLIWISGYWN